MAKKMKTLLGGTFRVGERVAIRLYDGETEMGHLLRVSGGVIVLRTNSGPTLYPLAAVRRMVSEEEARQFIEQMGDGQ